MRSSRTVPDGRWLRDRALAHRRELLGDRDPVRHRVVLTSMSTLMAYKHDSAGRLPHGVLGALPPDPPTAAVIWIGFQAVAELRRDLGSGTWKRLGGARSRSERRQ